MFITSIPMIAAFLLLIPILFIQTISAIPVQTTVQIDRLAQLITSHYQYEHLDPLINEYASALAKQLQFHDIHIAPDVEDPPTLEAQVIQAIQSHVENRLLSSAQPLPSLRDIIANHCPPMNQEEGLVKASCLTRSAEQLSIELDQFVEEHWKTWILEKTDEAVLSVSTLNDHLVSLKVERVKHKEMSLHQESPCEFHYFTRFIGLANV
ncbi:hypothetical protein BDA99DRAFT_177250 [Phascolomyces articulosus]|uniref:Uncharacterized protein n=1 Tax=Phascolomyces articulosus TaxID=60185 RepID=A0AAD5PAH6_9FUNG|nr:hypothetical protein BDA99DRAFT_177250 [Phascolomyces articulosus]